MRNCITASFKIEPYNGSSYDFYLSRKSSLCEDLNSLMNPLGRVCRSLKTQEDPLQEGEWLIAFFGPFVTKRDYEGTPEDWDYHVIFFEDNVWKHRDGKGAEITEVSEDLFDYFVGKHKINPQYFAVKQVEV